MALWKDPAPSAGTASTGPSAPPREPERANPVSSLNTEAARRKDRGEPKESVIADDLTIEGKIEGSGHVRLAGRFKGDVRVDGNLTIEQGAHLTGQVYAKTVVIGGELHGNITGASRVELLESGLIAGDVKAGVMTVAPGSRMRGQVECGADGESKNVKSAAAS